MADSPRLAPPTHTSHAHFHPRPGFLRRLGRQEQVHKKGGKSEAKNYRPVSPLPVLSKVMETVVAWKVTEHLDRHHLLCTRQFVFRQGSSAADLHLLLGSDLSAALDQGKATAVVALDIEGAFDRVWHEALVTKLRATGIDGALLPPLRDYMREVTVIGLKSEV
ncbi:putative RNA-directed DNA polymerase from transposon X-element [Chionoecetes opilio]|uniref:Putative RNA-directed DNA polymerase from transposon X-element n=1 Tax=Chionoecetes opilio TaxID=41210 RepID=A0A8J4Y6Y3_CHIOP|nr:putative RNA-directed DNA polymerase from transposon X-element [Chionoecetes opilio]